MKLSKELPPIIMVIRVRMISCVLLCLFVLPAAFSQSKTKAQNGILDLQNWNWNDNGIADLSGEWEFYWKKLYTPSSFDSVKINPSVYSNVPGFWNNLIPGNKMFGNGFGYATYRLRVLCPSGSKNLSLKFLTISSAYTLFVNGKELFRMGKVGTSKTTSTASFTPVIVPVTAENNQLDIVIQVSNFDYDSGGIWDFIKLGTDSQLQKLRIKNAGRNFFIAGSFLMMGIFYFVIYFFFKRRSAPLYFGLFCMVLAMRPLVTDELAIQYISNWSWQFIKRIEFISLYLTVPLLSLFSYALFPKNFSIRVLRYIIAISIPFVSLAVFTSPFIFRYSLRPFQLFMMLVACYGVVIYIRALKNKRPGSVYFLIGFAFLFITIINDLLYTSLIIESVHLVYAGFFVFIISQAITLSKQFFWTYSRLEIMNGELADINEELNKKNNSINEANEQLTSLNAELDSLVYRTSHDLRSPITSVLTLVEIIRFEEDATKRNEFLAMQKKTLFRLNSLITDTLDFARNKRTELNYEPVNFKDLIENALQDHTFFDTSKNIKQVIEIHQPGTFTSDKTRLNIIIRNLISNALKYYNRNEEVPYLKIVVKVTDAEALLLFEDNGQGISEKDLKHIFTLFYRASNKSGGSGIGLYIVKEAIDKLKGTINIQSQLNVGTTFSIVIPNHL